MSRPTGTVTFFFSDVEESTEALQRLGDGYRNALGEHRAAIRSAVHEAGGEIVDERGEEFFAVFSRAHDAIRAAIAAQQAHGDAELRVRIGLHTGEPSLDGDGYLGLDVHRAARICHAGRGGQVLLSGTTRGLAPDADARDLGEFRLKGIEAPERLFQLLAPGLDSRLPPPRAERVGRDAQARGRRLRGRWRRERPPAYDNLAWSVRALMPSATDRERNDLSKLRAALIEAGRVSGDVDAYLEGSDRRALERELAEYRDMSVVSAKAGEQVRRLEAGIAALEALEAARRSLERSVVAHATLPQAAAATTRAVSTATSNLRDTFDQAVTLLPPLSGKLRRTRHRGVYRLGESWVVRWHDEVGIERRERFFSAREAVAFARSVRLREKNQADFARGSITRYDTERVDH